MVTLKRHPITKKIRNVLFEMRFEGAYINHIYQEDDVIYANIHLPEHKDYSALRKIMPNLQQEIGAMDVKIGKMNGKSVELEFGMRKLEKIDFDESMIREGTLQVGFPSAFGEHVLDFEDGSSCHMLNGGVTRMGKTCLLLYIGTLIYLQSKGSARLYITSAKLKDFYPFEGLKGVKMAKYEGQFLEMLDEILAHYELRSDLLYSPQFREATDAKSIRKLYPEHYHLFEPIFLIVDEYARFAENKEVQKKVTEIVETAGFVNIHVIIASQRPDTTTVLKPRIRANLLVRMAFTTADKKNSEIILDREGAENLGKIAGRGMLIDSDSQIIQVPYIDPIECDKLLEPYREEIKNEQSEQGPIDHGLTDKIQSLISESISLPNLQGEFESGECGEPSFETNDLKWSNFPNTT